MSTTRFTFGDRNAGSAPFLGGFLDRRHTVAQAGFNRWLVPPAALAIHLCIGMAYGFSVFWLPLSRAIGVAKPLACAPDAGILTALTTTTCDWKVSDLAWTFTLFFVFLGSSAAIWGGWLERVGPRKAGFVAALCWSGGLALSAVGVSLHQLWLLWLGAGVIGGIGLGLGYISPVSTLIKWFPDRRGMATGMAIMGFGGGALVGAPLADKLMRAFATPTSVGVWQTFAVLAAVYLVFKVAGAFGYRVPPSHWTPEAQSPHAGSKAPPTPGINVHLRNAHKTPQFWLLWSVLLLNVSAGIGVIGMASPMLQEIFGGALVGHRETGFLQLDDGQKVAVAAIAAGFTGLLSLFNIGGRFFWATLSDRIGRRATYSCFFGLGILLYALVPSLAHAGSKALFVLALCTVLSMYGGGFATIPAYLADMFGPQFVGAIHGRILTAWSTAGIFGPLVVNYIREAQIARGVPRAQAYDVTMYVLSSFLIVGLVCNAFVRPVAKKWHMTEAAIAEARGTGAAEPVGLDRSFGIGKGGLTAGAVLAWMCVGAPILWGVWVTLGKALVLFR